MNQKTAKLLRRHSFIMNEPLKQVKRLWNNLPWNERFFNRRIMQDNLTVKEPLK